MTAGHNRGPRPGPAPGRHPAGAVRSGPPKQSQPDEDLGAPGVRTASPSDWSPSVAVHLHGLGHAHPEPEISNRFLELLDIGTDDSWILERVGIRCRRTVLPLDYIRDTRNRDPREALAAATESNAMLGARAARLALARAGIGAADIGLVIAGNSATDTSAPAEACN